MLQLDSIANLSMDIEDVCSLDVSRVSSPEAFEVFAKGINLTEDFLLDERWSHAQMDNSPRAQFDLIMLQMLPEVYDPAYLESHGGIFGIRLTGVAEYTVAAINRRVVVMHDLPQDMQSGEEKLHLEVAPDIFLGFARGLVLALSEDILHDDDEYEDRPISNAELQLHGMPAGGTTLISPVEVVPTPSPIPAINGTSVNDRLFGGDDRGTEDYLYGGAGADLLDGGRGRDYLYGGDGNDILLSNYDVGSGDVFDGGNGFDVYNILDSDIAHIAFNIDLSNGIENGTDTYFNTYRNIERFVGGNGHDTLNLGTVAAAYKDGDNGIAMLSDGNTIVWEGFETVTIDTGARSELLGDEYFYVATTTYENDVYSYIANDSSRFFFQQSPDTQQYTLQLDDVESIYATGKYGIAMKSNGDTIAWHNVEAVQYSFGSPSNVVAAASGSESEIYSACGDNASACASNASNYSACAANASVCAGNLAFMGACASNASACAANTSIGTACGANASGCGGKFTFISACGANASGCTANVGVLSGCGANASVCAAAIGGRGLCGANASACGLDILGCGLKAGACGVDIPGDIASACAVNVVPLLPSC